MLEYIFLFILGLFIGSFLNCTVFRVYYNETFLTGSSYCPKCKHDLNWLDLIPVFSYLFLGGKCRYCKEKISVQYPLVEILTGIVFALIGFALQASFFQTGILNPAFLILLFNLFIGSYFIMIFLFDLRWYIIPDGLTFSGIIVTLLWLFFSTFSLGIYTEYDLLIRVLSAFGVFLFFFALYYFSRGKGMGFGDVKLVILLGLLLGYPNILVALFIAFFLGALIGVIMICLQKKGIKSQIPFGPFLVLGTFIAMYWGDYFVNWYLSLM